MISLKRCILFPVFLTTILTGCAGTSNTPKSTAQIEKIDFKADTSPMSDNLVWIGKAKAKNPAAMFILGMMYRDNIGGVDHLENAQPTDNTLNAQEMKHERVRWQSALVDQHLLTSFVNSPTLFYEAPSFLETDDTDKEAISWLEEAAKRGYGNAEYVLGLLHWNGVVVPTDKDKAFDLIRRAALHGIANAQYHLGMIYEMGLERPADQKLANDWLQQALDSGNQDAVFILAMKYLDGIGVPKDAPKAQDILEKQNKDMHPWTLLLRDFPTNFGMACAFSYDKGRPENRHENDCGGEDIDPEIMSMLENLSEEERERFYEEQAIEERADHSLDYGIDYELASRWLLQAAQDPSHIEARLQLARVQEADCRFNSDLEAPTAEDIIRPLAENNYPHTQYMLAEYYKEYSCASSEFAQNALKWYLEADKNNDLSATARLALIYANEYECIVSENNIEQDLEKAYAYAKKAESQFTAFQLAARIAEKHFDDKNYPKAIEWYQKAIEDAEDDSKSEYYLTLAKIYDFGPDNIQDKNKAFDNYKKATQINKLQFIPTDSRIDLIRLGALYDKGTDKLKPNKKLAIEWYKRGLEASYEFILNPQSDAGKLAKTAQKALTALPQIDLIDAVVDQIKLEEGKDPNQFFSIKSALKPCLERKSDYVIVCTMNDPLFDESIQKAVTGITAITLAKTGKLDKDIILNTYYNLAILYGMDRSFKEKIRNYSPVYQKIHNETYFELPAREGDKIYNIWYLRQIPYAAAEVFKTLGNTSKTWDDYMKEAKKAVESDESLKTGFGYNLLDASPQPFMTQPE